MTKRTRVFRVRESGIHQYIRSTKYIKELRGQYRHVERSSAKAFKLAQNNPSIARDAKYFESKPRFRILWIEGTIRFRPINKQAFNLYDRITGLKTHSTPLYP